ncbi:MAG: Helix-hairpin-helix motif-containing protein [Frankiales bacterium]|nr:Helix-hairpin-helix motif-containing protein [Frankiales bacterium]
MINGSVGLVIASSSTAVAHADSGPGWTVPAVPAQQPTLAMDCAPGQIDLNHASLTDLQMLPDVSAPIAQRIVNMRPHDRTRDLLVVPGVGPDKLAAIEATGRACSTPLTLPPPAADVCTAAGQLDVNDPASQSGLAALFGTPTAQRIVAAQPFPDLAHAKVTLAAGAGPGKVTKYAARLCATPEPKKTGGVNFSYVYSAKGGRADLGKFALVLPAGTLTDPVGQWLRITPEQTPADAGPTWPSAEFSVLGAPWSDGSKHVYVTLPTDPALSEFDAGTAHPVVAHWSDGTNRTGGDLATSQASADGTTITAQVTHLSILDAISQGVSWVAEPAMGVLLSDSRFPAPTCDGSWTLNGDTGSWWRDSAHVDLLGALMNLPGNTVPPLGWPQKHCVRSDTANPYDATLHVRNNTRAFESLTQYGDDTAQVDGPTSPIANDPLQTLIRDVTSIILRHPVAAPGDEMTVTVPSGHAGAADMEPNALITAVWAVINETPLADPINQYGRAPHMSQLFTHSLSCVFSGLNTLQSLDGSGTDVLQNLQGLIGDCIAYDDILKAAQADLDSGAIQDTDGKLSKQLDRVSRFLLWLKVGRLGASTFDSWYGHGAGVISMSNYAPKPATDAQGRPVFDKCLTAKGYGWVVDANCQAAEYATATQVPTGSGGQNGLPNGKLVRDSQGHAWLDNIDAHTLQPIADGGTYLCLAKHYAVDWAADLTRYRDLTLLVNSATCDNNISDDRPINHGDTGGAVVLRQADGTSWVVWNGQRERIPTGAEFQCWVDPRYAANMEFDVWDQVTADQLTNWPVMPDGNLVSNCGNPANPTF